MSAFNKQRHMFDCLPDCPERKPGCSDHCERYKKRRAAFDKRKREVYGNPEVRQYMFERGENIRDRAAKKRKSHGLNKSSNVGG